MLVNKINIINVNLPKGQYFSNYPEKYLCENREVQIKNMQNLNIATGLYWKNYRLSDTVGGKYGKPFHTIKEKWPGTIKDKYMTRANNRGGFMNHFIDIVKQEEFYNLNTTDYLIVGIRVGDVMGGVILHNYVVDLNAYKNFDFEKYLDKTVIIVCGSHYNSNTPASVIYIKNLVQIFEEKGFKNIFVRAGNSPDDDVSFMCGADYSIIGKGGLQKLAGRFIKEYSKKDILFWGDGN